MQNVISQVRAQLEAYLPNILIAVAILVGGWLLAVALAALARTAVTRASGSKLGKTTEGQIEAANVGVWVGRAVFYTVIAFVLGGAFQALRLQSVADPLATMLDRVAAFVPQLAGAAILLGIGWAIASVLRLVVTRSLSRTRLDDRISDSAGIEEAKSIGATLGAVVFWLVLLLFLPAILDVLDLQGIVAPLQVMFDDLLGIVPNLFGAALILLLGWLVARIASRIVTSLLSSAGVDRVGLSLGMSVQEGGRRLSDVIGLIVYALILIPAAIAAFDTLGVESVSGPATRMLEMLMAAIPLLFGATIILGLAWVIGRLLSGIVTKLLTGIGFDNLLGRLGLRPAEGRSASEIAGYLAMVSVMLIAGIEAANMLGFVGLSALATSFFEFGARLLVGLVIFGVGLYLANLAYRSIPRTSGPWASLYAATARGAIVVLAAAMALQQIGLGEEIVLRGFTILLGAAAVAGAIAFGLGSRDVAERAVNRWFEESAN